MFLYCDNHYLPPSFPYTYISYKLELRSLMNSILWPSEIAGQNCRIKFVAVFRIAATISRVLFMTQLQSSSIASIEILLSEKINLDSKQSNPVNCKNSTYVVGKNLHSYQRTNVEPVPCMILRNILLHFVVSEFMNCKTPNCFSLFM